MKTATLTIEVPDDFKKGDKRCGYVYETCLGAKWCNLNYSMCSADNCPLEMQDDTKKKPYIPTCKYGHDDCVCDPAYIKYYYPEWYQELGCPIECDTRNVSGGICYDYDDEDK